MAIMHDGTHAILLDLVKDQIMFCGKLMLKTKSHE